MNRPTISICSILKNEIDNLPGFFESFADVVDEVHFTDTGSADGSIEWIEKAKIEWPNIKIYLHKFEWVDDFSAARNYSFSHTNTDYILWADLDDRLNNKSAFLLWRDHAMSLSDYWLNTYNYGKDASGKNVCSFARERVIKRDRGFSWNYPIHEGILPKSSQYKDIRTNYVTTWSIDHKRTIDELNRDRGRNLSILEKQKDKLDARLQYYLGKELYDATQYVESLHWLVKACADPKLEHHDRILGLQYTCFAYAACNQYEKAIQFAHQGLQLDTNRAEFWVCIGDCYLKMNHPIKATPAFNAAKSCAYQNPMAGGHAGMIFSSEICYTIYPREQLARIYANLGAIDKAKVEAKDAADMGSIEAKKILDELNRIDSLTKVKPVENLTSVDDIIISCPPGTQMYEWDADIAKVRGIGGSETAAVQMAYWLKKLTGRSVKVFNARNDMKVCDGVEYISNTKLNEYTSKFLPALHIAWRHTIPVTPARTAVWSHDLITPGSENLKDNSQLMCLSEFHKNYVSAMQGVSSDKIWLTRNGIDPERFRNKEIKKQYAKVIWPSSPDRGLNWALDILDDVYKEIPELELHIFYGTDNLRKGGMVAQADALEAMIKARPYAIYHGNQQQEILAKHFMESEVWLYSAHFYETFCISALESLASKCFPIVTDLAALKNTLSPYAKKGQAIIIEGYAETKPKQLEYAREVIDAIKQSKWKNIEIDLDSISWESVALDWMNHFSLDFKKPKAHAKPLDDVCIDL